MFIEWLPQLLAHIPSEAGLSAAKTVRLVAQAYPGSLTYIWRVSQQDWAGLPPPVDVIVAEIRSLVEVEDLEPFLEAMGTLTPPEMLLKDLIEEMAVRADSKDSQSSYIDKITGNLFSKNSLSNIRNSFASKHQTSWKALVGKLNKADIKKKVNELRKYEKKIREDKETTKKRKGGPALSDYSRWFGRYKCDTLELPGQYCTSGKPNPACHRRISLFQDKVTVLASLRRPVKITF
jgi:DNA-dependent protein kinase catalytic subunit